MVSVPLTFSFIFQRHRLIKKALQHEFDAGLHAVSIQVDLPFIYYNLNVIILGKSSIRGDEESQIGSVHWKIEKDRLK